MPTPDVLIVRAPGTNCNEETAYAFEQAGARTTTSHINRLLENPALLAQFQVFCIPGGFSFGDDVAAGRILANQFRQNLAGPLAEFKAAGKLILGICNGFQVLLRSGLLLEEDSQQGPAATLTWNTSGRFTDRWVSLATGSSQCVFLRGIEQMYLPIAHAEGRFVFRNPETQAALNEAGQLALRYAPDPETPDDPRPANPNGAQADVAGVCDPSGNVLGLRPHPERHIDPTHHPRWTRRAPCDEGDGLQLFRNAVEHFK